MIDSSPPAGRHPIDIDKVVTVGAGGDQVSEAELAPRRRGHGRRRSPGQPVLRNGALAFAYVATLLMEYVDEHKVSLNDTINRWMPKLPEANKVTLKMLANQTSGYPGQQGTAYRTVPMPARMRSMPARNCPRSSCPGSCAAT